MEKVEKFSISKRIISFKYAFNGLRILIKEEHNARIHLVATIVVTVAGFYFEVSPMEWVTLVLVMGLVISMEIVNSSIENICDFISPEKHDLIKKIKDLAAAAVLISALSAVIIGLIIFIPKVLDAFFLVK